MPTMGQAKRVRIAAGLAVSTLGLMLVGCGEGDPVSRAVERSASELSAMTGGGAVAAARPHREEVYAQAARRLESALRENSDSPAAGAAQALLAQVRAGQGATETVDAETAARRVLNLASLVETTHAAMTELSRTARLADTFEPQAELADIQTERQRHVAELEVISQRIAELEERIAAVQAEIEGHLDAARQSRLEESQLRSQALRADPVDRAAIVEEAVEFRRVAEQRERRAAELELRVNRLQRQLSDARMRAEGRQDAIDAIDALAERVEQAEAEQDDTSSARASRARALRESLDAVMTQLRSAMEEEFLPELEEAISAYEQAASAAGRARGAADGVGGMTATASEQAIGQLRVLETLVAQRVAEAAGVVGDAELRESATTRAQAAAEAAGSAYANAARGANSLRPNGRLADRTSTAAETMQARADALGEHGVLALMDASLAVAPAGDERGAPEDAGGMGDGTPMPGGDEWGTGDDVEWGDGADDWGDPGQGGMGDSGMGSPGMGGGGGGGFGSFLESLLNFGRKPDEDGGG